MINTPNIVAIDDQESELSEIQKGLFAGGVPCLPILYQYDLATNKSGIDHVELDCFKPRVVVSDLNLREGSLSNVMELAKPIETLLKKLDIKGPYVLVFWSAVPEHVDAVMTLLKERFYSELNLPIYFTSIDKNQYSGAAKAQDLKQKLKEIISESKLFNALIHWEGRVASAARETTNSLFKLTRPKEVASSDNYQVLHTAKLQDILAVIGNETIGVKNAGDEPEVALDSGLAPVLHDHLQVISEAQDRSVWLEAVPDVGKAIEYKQNINAHLNSFYHVEDVSVADSQSKRGTWIEFNEDYIAAAGNEAKLKAHLGRAFKAIKHEEFLDSGQGTKAEREEARNATKLGFLELSAECDQAQRKTKLHKYLLSALIPIEHYRFTEFGDEKRSTAHSGIYRTPNLIIDGLEYIVKITFMYQIGIIPDIHKWLGLPKFRLKDQILADISYQCSQHASRPGIIRFG
jgi:hypothetical protein